MLSPKALEKDLFQDYFLASDSSFAVAAKLQSSHGILPMRMPFFFL